jgi:DNA repair exonuclease SbcCD ATPase subunit
MDCKICEQYERELRRLKDEADEAAEQLAELKRCLRDILKGVEDKSNTVRAELRNEKKEYEALVEDMGRAFHFYDIVNSMQGFVCDIFDVFEKSNDVEIEKKYLNNLEAIDSTLHELKKLCDTDDSLIKFVLRKSEPDMAGFRKLLRSDDEDKIDEFIDELKAICGLE